MEFVFLWLFSTNIGCWVYITFGCCHFWESWLWKPHHLWTQWFTGCGCGGNGKSYTYLIPMLDNLTFSLFSLPFLLGGRWSIYNILIHLFFRQNNIFWNTMMPVHGYRILLWCYPWVKRFPGIWWESPCLSVFFSLFISAYGYVLQLKPLLDFVFGHGIIYSCCYFELKGWPDFSLGSYSGWWDCSCECGGSPRCHRFCVTSSEWGVWRVR